MTTSLTKRLRKNKITCVLLFVITLGISFNSYAESDTKTVLVSSIHSNISIMNTRDIRRVFLGLRPIDSKQIKTPIINASDKKTYKSFLKNIMFLTERGYKRKLLKRVFRQGADNITSYDSLNDLITSLGSKPNSISFMLKKDALRQPDIKIIQALW